MKFKIKSDKWLIYNDTDNAVLVKHAWTSKHDEFRQPPQCVCLSMYSQLYYNFHFKNADLSQDEWYNKQ